MDDPPVSPHFSTSPTNHTQHNYSINHNSETPVRTVVVPQLSTSPTSPALSASPSHRERKKKKKDKKIRALKNESKHNSPRATPASDWISLNIGGKIVQTTRSTICKDKNSMLSRMFASDSVWASTTDENGAFMLDRDYKYFRPLLNYLRDGELIIDEGTNAEGVLKEAEFFQISEVIKILESRCNRLPDRKKPFLVVHRAFYLTERVLSDYILLEGPVEDTVMSQLEGCTFNDGIWVLTHSRLIGSDNKITFSGAIFRPGYFWLADKCWFWMQRWRAGNVYQNLAEHTVSDIYIFQVDATSSNHRRHHRRCHHLHIFFFIQERRK